ncbi:MAG: DUF2157 domain-containing protein [Candidatus Omnitrophota bacterium]
MGAKAIRWLYQELPALVAKGILTQESSDKLRQHYGAVKSVSKTRTVLIICAVLGALLIGLGIILLLAHNWEQFSRFTRAVLSFLPLVLGQALVFWTLAYRPQSPAFKEGSATFLSLMVGASIALVSQTYNIPGDTGTFILSWMLLSVPLVYLLQASLPAAIYLVGITSWAGSYWDNPSMAVLFWPLAAIVVPHFIWALRQELYTLRLAILSLVAMVCVSFAASFSLGKTWPGSWVIIFPSLYAVFYSLGCRQFSGIFTSWQRPLRIFGGIALFVLAFQFTFRYVWQYADLDFSQIARDIGASSAWPDHLITLAILATALLLFYDNLKSKKWNVALFGAVPFLAIAGYFLKEEAITLPLLIFNLFLFVLSISRIMFGIRSNSLGLINSGMLILALLIIARFFDSDIGFIIKGLVFIAVGSGFLITNAVLARRLGGAQ